jgi:GNAT superfamily N-acetyltransferase
VDEVLQDASPPALARAAEQNMRGFFRLFRRWPRAEVHDGPDLLYTLTDIPFSVFNAVIDAQLDHPHVEKAIEAAIARAEARNVPMFWITGPSTMPADLGESLIAHGFVHEQDEPQMAVALQEMNEDLPAPPGLKIERVRDFNTLTRWCWVYNTGFGMPAFTEPIWLELFRSIGLDAKGPMCHFLGRVDGVPVAASSLLLAGGVAGVGAVTTLPDTRRRGIGTAMTLAVLREGRALGYRFGVLGASDMGVGLYRRIGFGEVCRINEYAWKPGE